MIIILYIFTFSILFCDISKYNVTMLGINVAEISIKSENINKGNLQKITYRSQSQSALDFFYPVSNYYETTINQDNILKYKKIINEKKYKETIDTFRRNDTTFYSMNQFICKGCHNIFSLLNLAKQDPSQVINKEFIIDRDGDLFKAYFSLKSNNKNVLILNLDINVLERYKYSNKKNDIFLWGLFLPNSNRLIYIDTNENQIIKCEFINSMGTLKASLIK